MAAYLSTVTINRCITDSDINQDATHSTTIQGHAFHGLIYMAPMIGMATPPNMKSLIDKLNIAACVAEWSVLYLAITNINTPLLNTLPIDMRNRKLRYK